MPSATKVCIYPYIEVDSVCECYVNGTRGNCEADGKAGEGLADVIYSGFKLTNQIAVNMVLPVSLIIQGNLIGQFQS